MEFIQAYVFTILIVAGTLAQGDDGDGYEDVYVTRPYMTACAEKAVCSNVFEFIRRLPDDTTRKERRHIANCICPRGRQCENLPGFRVRQSRIHTEVLCERVTDLPTCKPQDIARRMHVNTDDYGTYFDIQCTCPLHFSNSLGRAKATRLRGVTEPEPYTYIHNYECNRPGLFGNRQN